MAINFKLIITDKAKEDLEEIYDYISKSLMAENTAIKFMQEFENSIFRLKDMPESCSIIETYKKRRYPYRKLLIKNYVVIYRVDDDKECVYITRVVYGGRNYLNEI